MSVASSFSVLRILLPRLCTGMHDDLAMGMHSLSDSCCGALQLLVVGHLTDAFFGCSGVAYCLACCGACCSLYLADAPVKTLAAMQKLVV